MPSHEETSRDVTQSLSITENPEVLTASHSTESHLDSSSLLIEEHKLKTEIISSQNNSLATQEQKLNSTMPPLLSCGLTPLQYQGPKAENVTPNINSRTPERTLKNDPLSIHQNSLQNAADLSSQAFSVQDALVLAKNILDTHATRIKQKSISHFCFAVKLCFVLDNIICDILCK